MLLLLWVVCRGTWPQACLESSSCRDPPSAACILVAPWFSDRKQALFCIINPIISWVSGPIHHSAAANSRYSLGAGTCWACKPSGALQDDLTEELVSLAAGLKRNAAAMQAAVSSRGRLLEDADVALEANLAAAKRSSKESQIVRRKCGPHLCQITGWPWLKNRPNPNPPMPAVGLYARHAHASIMARCSQNHSMEPAAVGLSSQTAILVACKVSR